MSEPANGNGNGNGNGSKISVAVLTLVLTLLGGLGVWVNNIQSQLDHRINREVERNNRLEFQMGGVMKVNELFTAGKLDMGGVE